MALKYHPKAGAIVICDYDGFIAPEMVKRRLSIVLSPEIRHRGDLCTVVPLSTTEPENPQPFHLYIEFEKEFPKPFEGKGKWLKGDMVYTVSFKRLFLPFLNKNNGTRVYDTRVLEHDVFLKVQKCVLCGLGMNRLTKLF